jgi:hypothetical protein
MRVDPDGWPATGPGKRLLGAVPGIDIIPEDEMVYPGTEGMSVAPNDPANLPEHRRPPEFGGTGRDPVWGIDSEGLPTDLNYAPDELDVKHGFVEPATVMTFDGYQDALAETRELWIREGDG